MAKHIIGEVYNTPWAILPSKLEEISGVIEARLSGAQPLSESEIQSMALANAAPNHQVGQSIAVLPLWGTLHHHASIVTRHSGGTSSVKFCEQFKAAINDADIGTIVIHANGPGGTVFGCMEAANLIYQNRSVKRIVSIVDARAASATYWVASAASEMFVTPSGEVGSIGVYYMHRDISRSEDQAGVKTTLIAIPPGKVAGSPFKPVSDEFIDKIQSDNLVYYTSFVESVARHRGVTTTTVEETFGKGGMVLAEKAVALKMADGVKTFDQVISDELKSTSGPRNRRSSASRKRQIQLAMARNSI